jgi:hypothetical protein
MYGDDQMAERVAVTAKTPEPKKKCSNSCKHKPSFNSSGSPADRILQLQRTAGNQAVQKLIKSRALQAKLRVGQPNDIYEKEADRVAEQVMRMPDPVLQLKCAKCNGDGKKILQAKESLGQVPVNRDRDVPPIVDEVLRSPGQPLDSYTRAFMEPRFGYDFSGVRMHTDAKAAKAAQAVNALAFTVGRNVVLGVREYAPDTAEGKRLLTHELTHVIQQSQGQTPNTPVKDAIKMSDVGGSQGWEIGALAQQVTIGQLAGLMEAREPTNGAWLQRQVHGTPSPVSVRSPAFEELVTQISSLQAGLIGRSLTLEEVALVREIFHNSIDYSRVRLIPTGVLEYRTVANFIRVPENFTISDEYMAQTLVHEMTHVWQYQHGGTSYISISLATQIAGKIRTGSRNAAYDYQITPDKSFFDFLPEQQGLIVQNYFSMLRDKNAPPQLSYVGNHLDARGEFQILSRSDREAEISRELPLHEPLIRQMQAVFPRPEVDLLTKRATEVMSTPPEGMTSIPEKRHKTLVKPLLEINF